MQRALSAPTLELAGYLLSRLNLNKMHVSGGVEGEQAANGKFRSFFLEVILA